MPQFQPRAAHCPPPVGSPPVGLHHPPVHRARLSALSARRARAGGAVLAAAALVAALALPLPAAAQDRERATFDLTLRGLRAGLLAFDAVQTGDRYAVAGRLESAGLVAAIRRFRYDAQAEGRVTARGLSPARYSEVADTGRRQSEALITWQTGVPTVHDRDPERAARPWAIDPAEQRGTLDPLSALYATLRDAPRDGACAMRLEMFDGDRRTRLTLSTPRTDEGTVTCTGEYRRIAGFSPEDMAERSVFPFRLVYAPAPDGRLSVREVVMDTVYGRATLHRR